MPQVRVLSGAVTKKKTGIADPADGTPTSKATIRIDVTGDHHDASRIVSAIQLALFGAGYDVTCSDHREPTSMKNADIGVSLMATTFDNIAAVNRLKGKVDAAIHMHHRLR
jgi:hypothetical protein